MMNIEEYIASGIVESVVLGLASPAEAEEMMLLRKQYPQLDKAIIDFEQSLEQQGLRGAVSPPKQVKAELFNKLEHEFAKKPMEQVEQTEPERIFMTGTGIPRFWKYVAAAALILFIANTIGSYVLYNKYTELNSAYSLLQNNYLDLQEQNKSEKERFITMYRDMQMMQDSLMAVVKMKGVAGKESNLATVYWDTRTKDVYLFSNNLPPAEPGKQYQLWAMVDGKPVDAGVIGNCEGLCKLKNIPSAQAFAVTLEKAGGSPVPTMSSLYVMGSI